MLYNADVVGILLDMLKDQSYGCIPICHKKGSSYVLLVRHSHGKHWGFPKGHAEDGETPQKTAERELKEETSIASCRFIDGVSFAETYTFVKNGERIEKTVIYFLVIVDGDCNTCPIEEIADVKWVTFPEVEMALSFDEARAVWRQAMPIAEEKLKWEKEDSRS